MEVTFHEPVDDSDLHRNSAEFEGELTSRLAQRLDALIRREPGMLRPSRIDWLLSSPYEGFVDASIDTELREQRSWRRIRTAARKRRYWERLWGRGDFAPDWVGRGVSPEIQEAEANGWFPPGGAALDSGCGTGEVAAWLAACGHPSVGVDIALPAIEQARREHGERPGSLRFLRANLCEEAAPGGPFQIIIDRGCFHQIAAPDQRRYAAFLASVSDAETRLMVFARAFRDGIPFGDPAELQRKQAELMLAFGTYFVLERAAPTYLDRYRGQIAERQLPGIVFWLHRRR